ncbi:MAG: transglycosylase family protein [Actinomycetes bacterium]
MVRISLQQPVSRRAAEIALACVVALSVVVVPGLFHPSSKAGDASAASAPASQPETPTADATSGADPVSTSAIGDPSAAQEIIATPVVDPLPPTDPLVIISLVYNFATPEERAAADRFFSAPPPDPTPAPQVQAAVSTTPDPGTGSVWDRVAYCESHNVWSTHTAPGFSGGLQFADASWRSYGGTAYSAFAWQASREEQIVVAERILASAGWKAWPACSRKLGLR